MPTSASQIYKDYQHAREEFPRGEEEDHKIIPGFFTEKSALKLVFGALIRAQKGWRRIKMTERERCKLKNLRVELFGKKEKEATQIHEPVLATI